jgi:monoterpene epsilon-lactone hydrolase
MDTVEAHSLYVPAKALAPPASVSPKAQAMLGAPVVETAGYPPLDDAAAWRSYIAAADAGLLQRFAGIADHVDADVQEIDVDGVRVYDITPAGADPGRIQLDIHGGALVMGAGECCRAMGIAAAARAGARTWAVDYRMPPDHPYPAGLDDCMTVYRALLRTLDPGAIVVGGGSAGGNLAAALMLRARDEGVPFPAALVLLTPELDLTESGDSFQTNLGVDNVLTRSLMAANELYAGGHDLTEPYVSPLFGDFTAGFPPTFLQAGTRDLFLSNAVRMHRALRSAGVEAELHVFEAMPHGGFGGAPEDAEMAQEVRRYVAAHWQA